MAKTLDEGFEAFLSKLKPLESEHDKAKNHKDSVFGCLKNNFKCTRLFETGSFGNGTSIRHHSDTDYFASIPNDELYSSSSYSLRLIKEALQETFPKTEGIKVNTPAVMIPFGYYASESMEVTPCSFRGMTETPLGNFQAYDIADGDSGWMLSSPNAHNAYVQKHHARLDNNLKPLIQLVKAWKYYNSVPINSFYLELRITKYAEGEKSIQYDIDIKNVLKFLDENELSSIQDPMGISGLIKACNSDSQRTEALSKVSTGYSRALKARNNVDKPDACFSWWDLFFNNEFPAR